MQAHTIELISKATSVYIVHFAVSKNSQSTVALEMTKENNDSSFFFYFVRGSLLPNMLPLMEAILDLLLLWTTAVFTM